MRPERGADDGIERRQKEVVGDGTYTRVVQTENVAVAIVERSDKALEIGAVICELDGANAISQLSLILAMVWEFRAPKLTFSKTVFCSVSVRGRILTVCCGLMELVMQCGRTLQALTTAATDGGSPVFSARTFFYRQGDPLFRFAGDAKSKNPPLWLQWLGGCSKLKLPGPTFTRSYVRRAQPRHSRHAPGDTVKPASADRACITVMSGVASREN